MTRREIKFALEVEQVLNQISEPEYREIVVEVLTLMNHLEELLMTQPKIPMDQPFEVDVVVYRANQLFVEHNVSSCSLIVLEKNIHTFFSPNNTLSAIFNGGSLTCQLMILFVPFLETTWNYCFGVLRKWKSLRLG